MTIQVQERIEGRRGCGYRKPGGIYLVGPPTGQSCCRLPFPLEICPTCGHGIHQARSWTWVDAGKLFGEQPCSTPYQDSTSDWPLKRMCPLESPAKLGRAGLLWIGEKFYPTLQEAAKQGISRRIPAVPKGFEPGKTWVLLAHRFGHWLRDTDPGDYEMDKGGRLDPEIKKVICRPAIFSVFRPSAVEYVVNGSETQDDLERLAVRGLTPVRVVNRVAY